MLEAITKNYLRGQMPGGVVSLYSNRLIKELATGMLGLFLPVFLLEKYGSLNLVLLFFAVSAFLYLVFAPLGAISATKMSFNRSIILSVFFGTAFFISLLFFDKSVLLVSCLLLVFGLLDRIHYWIPYHSGIGKFTDRYSRGKTISLLASTGSLFKILLPALAGFIIAGLGFNALFVVVAVVYLASLIPLTVASKINEYYSFTYWQTWKVLLHKRDRRILMTYVAEGAIDVVNVIVWPIFIWQILQGDYKVVGIVSSLIIFASILLQLLMGSYVDKFNKKKMLRYGTFLYSLGWIFKVFVQSGFTIFVASTYHSLAAITMRTPLDNLIYEKAADAGHYIDEYTVLREMSLNIGRLLMLLVVFLLAANFGLTGAFLLAAIASFFINFI